MWEEWLAAAEDSLSGARLCDPDALRSAASRYYYAAYHAATAILHYLEVTPPAHAPGDAEAREAWSHVLTLVLLERHLEKYGTNPSARRKLRPINNSQCPAYRQPELNLHSVTGTPLRGGIRTSPNFEFGRYILGVLPTARLAEDDAPYWMPDGWCEIPKHQQYVIVGNLSRTTLLTGCADVQFHTVNGRRSGHRRHPSTAVETTTSQ